MYNYNIAILYIIQCTYSYGIYIINAFMVLFRTLFRLKCILT